jgi:hypothetical protein
MVKGARAALLAAGLVLGMAAAGCGSKDATAPTTEDLPGSYNLAKVDGASLPATVWQGPYNDSETNVKVLVVSSTLILDPSGRYAIRMQLKVVKTNGDTAPGSVSDTGQYERNGSALRFVSDNPGIADYPGDVGTDGVQVGIDLVGNGDPPAYLYRK